jgi:hypothetical protein
MALHQTNVKYDTVNRPKHSLDPHPTSYISARLVTSLEEMTKSNTQTQVSIIVLSFFAAEHVHPSDPRNGAKGILQSLLAQLLYNHQQFDLDTLCSVQHKIGRDTLASLAAAFSLLVDQLPANIKLVCIVDYITIYEDKPKRCHYVQYMLDTLVEIAAVKDSMFCCRKIMVSSPNGSRSYRKRVPKDDVLIIPAHLPSQGGYTTAKWNTSLRFLDDI